jgi:hypothetical protein
MSTLKVDTYLTRGGASEIAIDKLKGVTAAGSMLVVGEGGTNTTNLQQGLVKCWGNLNGSTFGLRDSFNVGSVTDNGTGDYTVTFTTAMANANYVTVGMGGHTGADLRTLQQQVNTNAPTTAACRYNTMYSNGNKTDASYVGCEIAGDLA